MKPTNKDLYSAICENTKEIPIFSRPWWLDTVAGRDAWDVAVVQKGQEVLGTMPYVIKKRRGFTLIYMPHLTQTIGPWIRNTEAKYGTGLGRQKEIMSLLIEQLPHFDKFEQRWHYSMTNWLPFYWKGYQQTTRYTYVIENVRDEEAVWGNLQENVRREIRKAKDRNKIQIREVSDINLFLRLNKNTFNKQGMSQPYTDELVIGIDHACSERKCKKILIAEDNEGVVHAGIYTIWDNNSLYYLMGGANPMLRNSGAMSLCMWTAICDAMTNGKVFDFEGSMLEPVERFFRGFGAIQKQYHAISKTNSKLLLIKSTLSQMSRI